MERLTKAAVATGAAAVLLLGGAGTMAYWTAQGTASGAATLTSGTLSATNGSCGTWTYATGTTGAGTAVNLIVPGDVVQTTCTVGVAGTGDHLSVQASLAGGTFSTNTIGLTLPALTINDVTLTTANGATLSNGIVNLSQSTGPATLSLVVTATFPYGDATTTSTNTTQNSTAVLSDVVISFVQQNPNA